MLSLVALVGQNRELGKKGRLLWRVPGLWFKRLTMGHPVIMGRRTYESIPEKNRPLVGRTNIVVTSNKEYKQSGIVVVDSLEAAMKVAKKSPGGEEVFVGGGGVIYKLAIGRADRLYLTVVEAVDNEADTFFPEYGEFGKVVSEEEREVDGLKFVYMTLER